jgi:hypothetical protein
MKIYYLKTSDSILFVKQNRSPEKKLIVFLFVFFIIIIIYYYYSIL